MNTTIQTEMLRIAANAALRGYVVAGNNDLDFLENRVANAMLRAAFEPLGMSDKFDARVRDQGKIYVLIGQTDGYFTVDTKSGAVGDFIITALGDLLNSSKVA